MTKRARAITGALAIALVAAGCSGANDPLPTPVVEETENQTTDADGVPQSERADQVLQAVGESLDKVFEAKSIEGSEDRITGPAAEALKAEFSLNERFGSEITKITTEGAASSWAASEDFPRVAMAVTNEAEGENSPQLLVLSQEDGKANYKLWGFASLFPRETELEFSTDTEALAPTNGEGLVASPEDVVAQYGLRYSGVAVDVPFGIDALQQSISDKRKGLRASVGETGNATIVGRRKADVAPLSISTTDGGAVTMAPFEYELKIERTDPEATITVGDQLAMAINGSKDETSYEVQGELVATYDLMVAFYIPPADGGEVMAIAASTPYLRSITDSGKSEEENE